MQNDVTESWKNLPENRVAYRIIVKNNLEK